MRYLSDALMEFIERNKSGETKKKQSKNERKMKKNNKETLNDFYY